MNTYLTACAGRESALTEVVSYPAGRATTGVMAATARMNATDNLVRIMLNKEMYL